MAGENAITLSTASEALKRFYLPGLIYQLNNANPVLSVIEQDSESVAGDKAYFALRYGRQGGVAARGEAQLLPQPNSRKTRQAVTDTKNIFARIQISDKAMKASRSNAASFVNLLEADLDDCLVDAKDQLSRMIYGDGTGKLATCTAQTAVSTLTVSSVQYLTEGMMVSIVDNVGATKVGTDTMTGGLVGGGAREVTMVDDVTNQITLSGAAVTTLATDLIIVNGAYGLEITGFASVFTPDNTIYGVNRATNKWFNPTVINLAGAISDVAIQKGSDDVEKKAGGNTNFYATTHGVRRAYQNLLQAQKRFVDTMKLTGGWEVLSYNNKPFTADKYCQTGTIYGLDLSTWKFLTLGDWDWLNEDGSVLERVPEKAIWEAAMVKYGEVICNKPRGNFKMYGITEM